MIQVDENKNQDPELWDDGAYGTGRVKPPKTHSGIIALLLVLVIFLTGIITVLSLLNVRLFKELNTKESEAEEELLSISFSEENTAPSQCPEEEIPDRQAFCQDASIDLQSSPQSVSTELPPLPSSSA